MGFESGPKILKKGTWESAPVEKKTDNFPEQEEDQKVRGFRIEGGKPKETSAAEALESRKNLQKPLEGEDDQKVTRIIRTPEGLKEVPWGQPIETEKEKAQAEELETWESALEKSEEKKAA